MANSFLFNWKLPMSKSLLFSVTAKDCRFDYYRGTGKGGQKRNKTCSAVRCTHIDSGAVGQSDDTRSQHKNKRTAFRRMAETKKFTAWHKLEAARVTGRLRDLDEKVDRSMNERFLRVEGKNDRGLWAEITNGDIR